MSEKEEKADSRGSPRKIATRYTTVNFVWYQVLGDLDAVQEDVVEGIAKSSDISTSGVGLLVPTGLPVGRLVFLEIATKTFNLSAVGKVVYSNLLEGGTQRAGIQFLVIPPNDRLLLLKHFGSHGES